MPQIVLLTGFAPFGGERSNPSWEVASQLDGHKFNGVAVKSMRLPVNCRRASQAVIDAIAACAPAAVVGLGQAGGRPVLSLEKVAINLVDPRADRERDGGLQGKPVIAGGPDAYFTRLPLPAILRRLKRYDIPAAISLSAGVYVCNTVMYSALHTLRRRRTPAGFIHLPYEAAQAARHRAVASMSLATMTAGVEIALETIARTL
ncbi:MAG: pyroglutamyl-peptidase I [Deltaproteobacteria bacterium]|nr:pyroglutamyl-peptidase I [Deltaproteobacteria bacterium]